MDQPTPTRYALSLLKLVEDNKARQQLAREAGLDADMLAGESLPLRLYCQLFERVVDHLQQQIHGEQAGVVQRFSRYRLLLESMTQASTLREAIERADTFFRRLSFEATTIHVAEHGDEAEWVFGFSDTDEPARADSFSMDGIGWLPGLIGRVNGLWIWHRLAGWLIGEPVRLIAVHVADARPENAQRYAALFPAPISYGQPHYALRFPSHYLERRITQSRQAVDALMENFLLSLFDVDREENLFGRIQRLIGNDFSQPLPSTQQIAKQLNMSVPTLHRHLQQEGTTYQAIKDHCRRQQAELLLRELERPVSDVAQALGFSDSGAFHRAFKRWTGMTPRQFRDSNH